MQIKTNHSRFKDADWYPNPESPPVVMIGGSGGIGSWTAFLMSRAGFIVSISDFDTIEEHNLGGQLFSRKQVGMKKVHAIAETIKEYNDDPNTYANVEKITEESPSHNLMISAFDNMEARKTFFKIWKENPDPLGVFIDGRLEAEQMQIFCIKRWDEKAINDYETNHLFSDNDPEVREAACTMKQTSHAAAMIASHIVGFFTNYMTNMKHKTAIRVFPYYWEYFIPANLITTKQTP